MKTDKRIFIQKKTHAYILPGIYGVGYTYSHGMTKPMKGLNYGTTLVLMENGEMNWYAIESRFNDLPKQAFKMIRKDPEYVFQIRKVFEKLIPRLIKFTSRIAEKNLKKITNRQLWQIIDQYLKLYLKIYPWGEPIALGLEDSLGGYLKDYLKSRFAGKDVKSLTEIYNIFISPKERSFVKREADDLLKIVVQIQYSKKQKLFFSKNQITEKTLKQTWPILYQKIKLHELNYCWVPYDYGVYLWEMKYFLRVIKDLVKNADARKELVKGDSYYNNLEIKQKRLIQKYKINAYHQKLFKVLRTCAYLLDYKKEQFTKSHYQIMPVFREVASRFKISETLARLYAPAELKAALLNHKEISKKRLESRYKHSVQYWSGDKFRIFEGRRADKFFNQAAKNDRGQIFDSLDGVIASAGKYVGRVRVALSARELKDFRAGEILVTHMTSPDFVPAMKKAGAIITDKGGVTCHAAVVSRELGVPCVVGTQNATKVLKTGELVEVNANHNSVKILKK
jgi:phosphohistidine swiveling domain-containing protein